MRGTLLKILPGLRRFKNGSCVEVAAAHIVLSLGYDLDDIPGSCANRRSRSLHLPEMTSITQGLQSYARRLGRVLRFRLNPGLLGI
jgi:hypothetical protein